MEGIKEITDKEKLEYFGASGLRDRELIELIASPYIRKGSIRVIDRLLETLDRNAFIDEENLRTIPGVTKELSSALMASLELGRRRSGHRGRQIRRPEDVYNEVRHLATRNQEHLIVIALNGAHEVIYAETVTIGLINLTVVHPREVFSNAIMNRASAIVVCHNHPSGMLEASEEDIAITQRLVKAGKILGIRVLDHVIISEEGYMSCKENGIMQ